MKFKQYDNYVSAKAENKTGNLYIYGDIVDEVWSESDVAPVSIINALNDMKDVSTLNIRINSYGGSVYAGNAIVNIIDNFKRTNNALINTYNDGICASMGTGILSCGDKIYSAKNATFMYHKPLTIAWGNENDLQRSIEILRMAEDSLISNYMRHFKGTEEEMRQLLADETWCNGDKALELGLIDEIIEPVKIVASAKGICFNGQIFSEETLKKLKNKIDLSIIQESEDEEMKLKYNEVLNKLGISETEFNKCETEQAVLDVVTQKIIDSKAEKVDSFVSKQEIIAKLGKELSHDELLNMIGEYPDIKAKAKEYENFFAKCKEDFLKAKIREKGDKYNEAREIKFVNTLTLTELMEEKELADEQARQALNAGKQFSGNATDTHGKPLNEEEQKKQEENRIMSFNPNAFNFK